uniref:Putative capsid protein n=1 Tax=Murri virus TaxID=2689338 RepID=A0A6B9KN32_9VIRU|nr:putative capsid protein [Murri virus]
MSLLKGLELLGIGSRSEEESQGSQIMTRSKCPARGSKLGTSQVFEKKLGERVICNNTGALKRQVHKKRKMDKRSISYDQIYQGISPSICPFSKRSSKILRTPPAEKSPSLLSITDQILTSPTGIQAYVRSPRLLDLDDAVQSEMPALTEPTYDEESDSKTEDESSQSTWFSSASHTSERTVTPDELDDCLGYIDNEVVVVSSGESGDESPENVPVSEIKADLKIKADPIKADLIDEPIAGPSRQSVIVALKTHTELDNAKSYEHEHVHYGDHSISGDGGSEPNTQLAGDSTVQNYLSWIETRVGYDRSHLVEAADFSTLGVQTTVVVNDTLRAQRSRNFADSFTMWQPAGAPVVTVSARYGNKIDVMTPTLLAGYMQDKVNFNTRLLAGAIQAHVGIPPTPAQHTAAAISLSVVRMDNTAMYGKGWALAMMRAVIERQAAITGAYQPIWNPAGATYIHRHWINNDDIGNQLVSDIYANRFIVLARDFTPGQLNCLQHLARGGQALVVQNRTNPTVNSVNWFSISIVVLFNAETAIPPIVDFAADEMRSMLVKLAETRRESQYLAMGFTKMLPLFAVKGMENEGGTTYYSCTLEVYGTFHWPRPCDSNAIWRWLNVEPPLNLTGVHVSEIAVLTSKGMSQLVDYGVIAGAMLTSGVSLAFHASNINGRYLNAAANAALVPQAQILATAAQYFKSNAHRTVPFIFRVAIGEIMQVTNVAFNHYAFAQDCWCADFTALVNVTMDNYWARDWDIRIPYLLDEFANSWTFINWPYQYGCFQRDVHINLKQDVVISGDMAGWYAAQGCQEYKKISVIGGACNPWEYINYSLAVFNGLSQEFALPQPFPSRQQKWGRGFVGVAVGPQVIEGPIWRVTDYIPEINTYRPGSVLSYDWSTDQTISWVIPRIGFELRIWNILQAGMNQAAIATGLLVDTTEQIVGGIIGVFDMLGRYGSSTEAIVNIAAQAKLQEGHLHHEDGKSEDGEKKGN